METLLLGAISVVAQTFMLSREDLCDRFDKFTVVSGAIFPMMQCSQTRGSA